MLHKFIVLKPGYGSRTIFDQAFAAAIVKSSIAFESEELVSVLGFVSAKLGIATLPRLSGKQVNMDNLSLLSIDDYACERTIGLVWIKRKYACPAAVIFQEFLIERTSGSLSFRAYA